MKKAKFRVVIFFIILFFCGISYALPGITDYMETQSGQYVYYRDFTYIDETYIGFLQYDEATYSARYFAPKTNKGPVTAEILFTIDASKDYFELTGEKILAKPADGDVAPLNYLHELLYEFNSRRKKAGYLDLSNTQKIVQDFPHFGGEVIISYDFYIPLFNLTSIHSSEGKMLFQAVCINILTSNEDTSFSKFTGFSQPPKKAKDSKKSATKMDKQWKMAAENMWLLGDNAFIFTSDTEIPINATMQKNIESNEIQFSSINAVLEYFTRTNLHTSVGSYNYLPETKISKTNNSLIVESLQFNILKNTWTVDIKIIKHKKDSIFSFSGITVFYDFFYKNKKYFTDIIAKFLN
ncbi:MAG: hypothetical protein GX220_06120 [Treponema sp.]|nr:hypothetical protein [Treponema sp.]